MQHAELTVMDLGEKDHAFGVAVGVKGDGLMQGVNHDWPWWRKMLPHYIENRLGW